jgi:hypothetical protein
VDGRLADLFIHYVALCHQPAGSISNLICKKVSNSITCAFEAAIEMLESLAGSDWRTSKLDRKQNNAAGRF